MKATCVSSVTVAVKGAEGAPRDASVERSCAVEPRRNRVRDRRRSESGIIGLMKRDVVVTAAARKRMGMVYSLE